MGNIVGFIRSSEYESWARLNGVNLEPAELSVLKALDRAYVGHCKKNSGGFQQTVSSHPLTAEIFDSMFK